MPDIDVDQQRIELVAGQPLQVASGRVELIAVLPNGRRSWIGTLPAGSVVAALPDVRLMIAQQLDSEVAYATPEELDEPRAVAGFAEALADYLPVEAGAQVRACRSFDELTSIAAPILQAELDHRTEARVQRYQHRVELDYRMAEQTAQRTSRLIRSPGRIVLTPNANPIVSILSEMTQGHAYSLYETDLPADSSLEFVLATNRIRYRPVKLGDPGWLRAPIAPLIAQFVTGEDEFEYVGLIPHGSHYRLFRPSEGTSVKLTEALADNLGVDAWEVHIPLPLDRSLTLWDLAKLSLGNTAHTWRVIACAGLGVSLLGLLTPVLTSSVFNFIVPSGEMSLLMAVAVGLVLAALLATIYSVVESLTLSNLTQSVVFRLQSALWSRTLAMPATFFRQFSSGDLNARVNAGGQLAQLVSTSMISSFFGAVFSLITFVLLLSLSLPLALAAALLLLLAIAYSGWTFVRLTRMSGKIVPLQRESVAWMQQLLSGISKIRVAGAERRVIAAQQERIRRTVEIATRVTLTSSAVRSFALVLTTLAPAVFFAAIVFWQWGPSGAEISSATYLAFTTAFGSMYAAIFSLASSTMTLSMAKPTIDLARPILEAMPEPRGEQMPSFDGNISFHEVSFRYGPDLPQVLDRVSFDIRAGEFVAIVGSSGAGKSTLLRMLLGFDEPTEGEILVDGRSFQDIDKRSFRSRLGVVVQGGELLPTSIMDNILGNEPKAEEDAWQAAERAALADDIRRMPMGMHTLVDKQTISAGQSQRIMLARAFLSQPKCFILDEATSALDNGSQMSVMESLSEVRATKVVVAHRLSTIQSADRILVLDRGTIVETGTFDELIAHNGFFADLVRHQLL